MNEGSHYVLCYDIRQRILKQKSGWPADRCQTFLFRPDIMNPIATDRHVLTNHYYDANTLPYTGPFSPFWKSLVELQRFLEQFKLNNFDDLLLAISIDVSLLTQSELEYFHSLLGNKNQKLLKLKLFECLATPGKVQESWEFIGFDVSDSGFTSAISNMGFTSDDDIPSLRAKWGPYLNEYHLFDQAENAVRFKEFSNQRAPEHAPFFVFGLWSISGDQQLYKKVIK